MQSGSSGTLIGWKSGQTTFVPLWDRMEGAWLRTLYRHFLRSQETRLNEALCTAYILQSTCPIVMIVVMRTHLIKFVSHRLREINDFDFDLIWFVSDKGLGGKAEEVRGTERQDEGGDEQDDEGSGHFLFTVFSENLLSVPMSPPPRSFPWISPCTLHCKDSIPEMRNKYSQKGNCPIPTFMFLSGSGRWKGGGSVGGGGKAEFVDLFVEGVQGEVCTHHGNYKYDMSYVYIFSSVVQVLPRLHSPPPLCYTNI